MASLDSQHENKLSEAPLELAENEPLELTVYVDHSVIEIFANKRVCITDTVFPTRGDAVQYGAFIDGGRATLMDLTAYQMDSMW